MATILEHPVSTTSIPLGFLTTPTPEPPSGSPKEQAAFLRSVEALLTAKKSQDALQLCRGRGYSDGWIQNAMAVCQLRLGLAQDVIRLLRPLCLQPGGTWLKPDAPLIFKLNLATALAMSGRVIGAVHTLDELQQDDDPRVQQLRRDIDQWKLTLSLWSRLLWNVGIDAKEALVPRSAPGFIS